jgi:hypothetical protein
MKKHLLIASIALTGLLKSNAQSFQVLDTTGASGGTGSVAQHTYNFTVDTSASGDFQFNLKNTTSSSISIKVKKRVISNSGSDVITFCLGSNCYASTTTLSPAVPISANSFLSGGFLTDFTATNVPNTASVVYTVFNSATPSDSISTTINYNVTATTGIKQFANNYSISNIAPNPASSFVSVTYDLNNVNLPASVKIYNMLGALVKTVPLETYTNNTKIDINSLEEGIYVYSVVVGGKAIKTSRLVVAR